MLEYFDTMAAGPLRVLGIAASGRGAGKTALAEAIASRLSARGFEVRQMPFAGPVREVAAYVLRRMDPEVTSWSSALNADKDKPLAEGISLTGRDLLLGIGNGCRAVIGVNVWADTFRIRAARALRENPRVVIVADDVRAIEEVNAIRALGGKLLYLLYPRARLGDFEGIVGPHHADHVAVRLDDSTLDKLAEEAVDRFWPPAA